MKEMGGIEMIVTVMAATVEDVTLEMVVTAGEMIEGRTAASMIDEVTEVTVEVADPVTEGILDEDQEAVTIAEGIGRPIGEAVTKIIAVGITVEEKEMVVEEAQVVEAAAAMAVAVAMAAVMAAMVVGMAAMVVEMHGDDWASRKVLICILLASIFVEISLEAGAQTMHLGLSIQKLYPKAALLLNILYGCLDLQV
eukprot:g10090.t1